MTHLTREEFKALPVGTVVKWSNPTWNQGNAQYYRKTADNAWDYFASDDPEEFTNWVNNYQDLAGTIEDRDFNLQFISVVAETTDLQESSSETTETEAA